jgi:hypothetical protein
MQEWQQILLQRTEEVAARTAKSGPRHHAWIGFLLRIPPEAHAALREIAKSREVAMTTYLRRLLIMSIAKERGEPLALWLDRLPAPMKFGNEHIRMLTGDKTKDNGIGMEGMCTHPGCDEIHL